MAYAAISLFGNQPQGEEPQWHEIAAWREGSLDTVRAEQVLSHVANNPVYFQQWLDLAEAESFVETELVDEAEAPTQANLYEPGTTKAPSSSTNTSKPSPLSSALSSLLDSARSLFAQPLPVYGGAFAAVLLAVLIVPMLQDQDAASLQQQLDRSSDLFISTGNSLGGTPPTPRSTRAMTGALDKMTKSDVERTYFQQGMVRFNDQLQSSTAARQPDSAQWQAWLSELSVNDLNCTTAIDADHCAEVGEDFRALGQWTLLNTAACQTPSTEDTVPLDEQFWLSQYELFQQISQRDAIRKSPLFSTTIGPKGTQLSESVCATANVLMVAGS